VRNLEEWLRTDGLSLIEKVGAYGGGGEGGWGMGGGRGVSLMGRCTAWAPSSEEGGVVCGVLQTRAADVMMQMAYTETIWTRLGDAFTWALLHVFGAYLKTKRLLLGK
jgi:hypothetical protein